MNDDSNPGPGAYNIPRNFSGLPSICKESQDKKQISATFSKARRFENNAKRLKNIQLINAKIDN